MRAPASSGRRWVWAAAVAVAVLGATLALHGEARGGRSKPAPVEAKEVEPPDVTQASPAPKMTLPRPREAGERVGERGPRAEPQASMPADAPPRDESARTPPSSEEELVAQLREEVDARPDLAVKLAGEAETSFPEGSHADESAYLKMRALVHLGDIVAAREAAERFFERHPQSAFARQVFRLTGMHPRPGPGT